MRGSKSRPPCPSDFHIPRAVKVQAVLAVIHPPDLPFHVLAFFLIAIPFGLIGAVAGHLIMGLDLTLLSLFGLVVLSGIVVNDSLILIDFINRAIRGGKLIEEAVELSGKVRFRPVILTSVTTIAGLMPLMLERNFQAQFLIPMAVSITFGLLVTTVLTLLLVPALYMIIKDLTGFSAMLLGRA